VPAPQLALPPQLAPQAPQLEASVCVFTHADPHQVWPAEHVHVPAVHDCPPLQATPHAPQLALSVAVFLH
jgi:hypothetical protein